MHLSRNSVSRDTRGLAPMTRKALWAVALCVAVLIVYPAFALTDAEKAARVTFADEFIRELSSTQQTREDFIKQHANDVSNADLMATTIRTATRASLELRTTINFLGTTQLDPEMDFVRTNLQELYGRKLAIQTEIITTAKIFYTASISGPKPDVDYAAMATHMPELTAQNDQLDKIIFDATKIVALSLVDDKPNKAGTLDHLILTKSKRQTMLKSIEILFASTGNSKDQNYTTSAAWLLHDFLSQGNRKSADEPW
jgi:hypothetical protein